jgi:hypothetical protein
LLEEQENNVDFQERLRTVRRIEKVSISMDNIWSDCLSSSDVANQMKCQHYQQIFSNIIIKKIDLATANCLKHMDDYLNEKMEVNIEEVADNSRIGMWVSLNEVRLTRKALIFDKVGAKVEIPKQLLHQETRYVTRIVRTPVDTFSGRIYEDVMKNSPSSRSFVVGDIIHYDLITPPPQQYTLRAKKWIFRDNSSSTEMPKKSPTYPSSVPTKFYVKVPDQVVMSDDIRIALWDPNTNNWTDEGLTDYQYSELDRMVQFYTTVVGTMALIKNRVADYPYRKWSLRPMAADMSSNESFNKLHEKYARFTLHTQNHEIVIDIMLTKCQLIRPKIPQLADLLGNDFTPGQLVRKLLARGINICPVYADAIHITGNTAKNQAFEEDVLEAISRSANALDFDSSSWNKELPSSSIGILVRESTVSTGSADHYDFECILAEMDFMSESHQNSPTIGSAPGNSGVKYIQVYGNDYGNKKNFSNTPRPKEISHVKFAATLNSRISQEAIDRMDRSNERFAQTVYKLLKLVKPFSF